jgi:hypothetical protein
VSWISPNSPDYHHPNQVLKGRWIPVFTLRLMGYGYRHGNDNQNQEKTNKLIEIRLNSCVITFKIKIHLLL